LPLDQPSDPESTDFCIGCGNGEGADGTPPTLSAAQHIRPTPSVFLSTQRGRCLLRERRPSVTRSPFAGKMPNTHSSWALGLFWPRLWTVRVLVLVTAFGPVIHRATANIATGSNPAGNF
jgi:hypothetical protein